MEPPEAAVALEEWFHRHARDLPWRKDPSPYKVLVTEFILQQTRVETGLRYWAQFLQRFPTLDSLADAPEEEVLRHWSGLGYYARARNLHATARRIRAEFGGRIPDDPATLLTLPGIGPYTAGAIASIAYDRPAPAIDGNQGRVMGRFLGLNSKLAAARIRAMNSWASALLCAGSPRLLNQAIMDLGNAVCTPTQPLCGECPLAPGCRGRHGAQDRRRSVTRAPRTEDVEAFLFVRGGRVWLQPPRKEGLLGQTWLPPLRPARRSVDSPDLVHTFSHRRWRIRVVRPRGDPSGEGRWVDLGGLDEVPHSSLTRTLLQWVARPERANVRKRH